MKIANMIWELSAEGVSAPASPAALLLALVWIGAVATAGANLWWNKALELLPTAECSLFMRFYP